MGNNKKSTKKIIKAINVFACAWAIVLFVGVMFFRVNSDIPSVLLYLCMGVVYVGGLVLVQKILERSHWKDVLEKANIECEEEEEKKKTTDQIPNFFTLLITSVVAFLYVISDIIDIVNSIISNSTITDSIDQYLPQCVNVLTLLICCVFIAVILYNVWRRNVFNRKNSFCIYGVGATIVISTFLQGAYFESTPMIPNEDVKIYYLLFGIFIFFFGALFDIAVKMKEEQDLTI